MKKLLLILLLAGPCLAAGPKYTYPNTRGLDDEMGNIYHDISNPTINFGTASTMTVTNLSVTHISSGPFTNWAAYTPTLSAGFGNTSSVSFIWRRVGDTIEINGKFIGGTTVGSVASITLPSGLSIDYTKFNGNQNIAGDWVASRTEGISSSDDHGPMITDGSTAGTLFFGRTGSSSNVIPDANANSVLFTGCFLFIRIQVPISGWSF